MRTSSRKLRNGICWPVGIAPSVALTAGGLLAAGWLLAGRAAEEAAAATTTQRAAITPAQSQRGVSLRDRLLVGLQARLKSEVAFVDSVVNRVHSGQLPQRLVDETFFWARQRASDGRYGRPRRPILFFQPAMSARARRLNVTL